MNFTEILRESGLKKSDLASGVFGYSSKKDHTYLIIKDDDEVLFYASVNGRLTANDFAKCEFAPSEEYENCYFGTQSAAIFSSFLSNDDENENDDEDDDEDEAEEDEAPAAKASAKKRKK